MAAKDGEITQTRNVGAFTEKVVISSGNGNFNYVSWDTTNGMVLSSSDIMTTFVSTKTPLIIGSNKNVLIQSGDNQPIVFSAGSDIEFVADNVTHMIGSAGAFGNDYASAQYKALSEYNSLILNAEDGSDTVTGKSVSGIIDSALSKLANYASNLLNISDTRSTDTSLADSIKVPESTGNFSLDLINYSEYAAKCNAAMVAGNVENKLKMQLDFSNEMEIDNIRQNLLSTVDYNEKQLKAITQTEAVECRKKINDMSKSELLAYLLMSNTQNIIV